MLKFPGFSLEKHQDAYIEEIISGERTIFVEVKRPNRGQWVFDFDPDDDAFFESRHTTKIYDTPVDGGYHRHYHKFRNCTTREYSNLQPGGEIEESKQLMNDTSKS